MIKVFNYPNRSENIQVSALNLKVYPNPVQNILQLEIPEYNGGMISLTVYTTEGKQIERKLLESTSDHANLDLSELKTGLYILSVEADNFHYSEKIYKE